MRTFFQIFMLGCSVVAGIGCHRSSGVESTDTECLPGDTRQCPCNDGAFEGVQSCDTISGMWVECDCTGDSATGHPLVAFEMEPPDSLKDDSQDENIDTDTAHLIPTDHSTAQDSGANTGDSLSTITDPVVTTHDSVSTVPDSDTWAQIHDTDANFQQYRQNVPEGFRLTIPDETYGHDGMYFTIIDSDESNDTEISVPFAETTLPQRADGLLEAIYPDNGTWTIIDGRDALTIHATSLIPYFQYQHGPSIEFSMPFEQPVDMRRENYSFSFEIFVPQFLYNMDATAQLALYDENLYGCIYSSIFHDDVSYLGPQWTEIAGKITVAQGAIGFSNFEKNPGEWIFHSFRIQLSLINFDVVPDTDREAEVLFYIRNIRIWRE